MTVANALAWAVLYVVGAMGAVCLLLEVYLRARGWRAPMEEDSVGRPAGRELTEEEGARLRKLRAQSGVLWAESASESERAARAELRAQVLALQESGASCRTIAQGAGVTKSRAGVLLQQARGR